MYSGDLFHCLQFEDQTVVDQYIDAIAAVQPHPFVFYRDRIFCCKRESVQRHFMHQTLLVGRFQQAGTKNSVHLDRASDHLAREWISGHDLCTEINSSPQRAAMTHHSIPNEVRYPLSCFSLCPL